MNQQALHRFYEPVRQDVRAQLGDDERLAWDPNYHGGFAVLAPNMTVLAFMPCGPGGAVKIVKGNLEALNWLGIHEAERRLQLEGGFTYPEVLNGTTFGKQGFDAVEIRGLFLSPLVAGQIFVEEAKQLVN